MRNNIQKYLTESWDFLLWEKINKENEDRGGYHFMGAYVPAYNRLNQLDWNQSIVSKINKISALIHKETLCGGANVIMINSKTEDLFLGNPYYTKDHNSNKLGHYDVIVDSTAEDGVLLYNKEFKQYLGFIKIENYDTGL